MKEIRIGYTGGGTGGHIYPLLAVAEEVKRAFGSQNNIEAKYYYFGAPFEYANDFISLGIKIVKIIPFKLRRYFSIMNIFDALKMPFAFLQAIWKMFIIMPDVVFSKGGTGSLPVVFSAYLFSVPVFVHESDSVPGSSNSLSFKLAKRIGVAFEKTLDYIKSDKVAVVGNPIRSFLTEKTDVDKEKAKKIFGFDSSVPLILVLGGSQGSVRINDFIIEIAPEILSRYQILHQTGAENFDSIRSEVAVAMEKLLPAERARYKIVNYFKKEIKEALIASDIVISRSGSGAIFEIAYFGRPSILIPLAESARNHQFYNAYEYSKTGGCLVVEEENLKNTLFINQLDKILKNEEIISSMSQKALTFSRPMSATVIAKELINLTIS